MKYYTIKPECLDSWGNNATAETIITETELHDLARAWDKPVEELIQELSEEEIGEGKIVVDGQAYFFAPIVALMDDEIRERVHKEGVDDPQEFYDRYYQLHAEKYKKPFVFI